VISSAFPEEAPMNRGSAHLLAIALIVTAFLVCSCGQVPAEKNTLFVSEVTVLAGHADRASEGVWASVNLGIVFSPDSKYLLSFSSDGTMRLWDVESAKEVRRFAQHKTAEKVDPVQYAQAAAFMPDGRKCISIHRPGQVLLHDVETGKEIDHFQAYSSHGDRLALSPDGKYLLTSGGDYRMPRMVAVDCQVKLWDLATHKVIRRFDGHTSFVNCIALSPDGKKLLTGAGHWDGDKKPVDCTVRLWDVAAGKETRRFEGHTYTVGSVAFSPDERLVASGGWDNSVRLWDASTGKQVRELKGHTENVWSIAFSPDGNYLLSGSGTTRRLGNPPNTLTLRTDCNMRMWSHLSGKELISLGHPGPVNSVAFSPDGKWVASGCDDGMVRLHRLK
jgi:WD40 repeat protein